MKKKLRLLALLFIMLIFATIIANYERHIVTFDKDNDGKLVLSIKCGTRNEEIYPWYDSYEEVYYFFLPAFIEDNKIYNKLILKEEIEIDGEILENQVWEWQPNVVYTIGNQTETISVSFMKSEELPTLFLQTESQSMDMLHKDKEYAEKGRIVVAEEDGTIYLGELNRISCKGQTSFETEKKSYSITLKEKNALCGLEYGKKYNLLAMCYEKDKVHSKLVFDMAKYLDMEFAMEATWVDVYCNGNYLGLYLLTEAITIEDGRIDIADLSDSNEKANIGVDFDSLKRQVEGEERAYYEIESPLNLTGGYVIEKTPYNRIESKEAFFVTDINKYCFIIKEPSYPSKDEVEYIEEYIQDIEQMIASNDSKLWNYLDVDSFAKQFLIDKIVMENDAMWDSTFFYKDKNDLKLMAGPLWDYDRSCGAVLTDYTNSIDEAPGHMNEWYLQFYQNEEFMNKVIDYYMELLPFLETLLNERIDEYTQRISASRQMDSHIVKEDENNEEDGVCIYDDYENSVRYLKFFLANRINYLNELWGIEYKDFDVPNSNGEVHKVKFWSADGNDLIQTICIVDGECISDMPDYDEDLYDGWAISKGETIYKKMLNDKIPIYEDLNVQLCDVQ